MAGAQIPIPFVPHRFLRGGHLQTIGSYLLKRRFSLPPAEARLVEVEPGVSVLCKCNWQPERQSALTLVLVHGLEGSSESGYMQGIAQKGLVAGMNVVRVNQRNCGGTNDFAPTLYHSGRSNDIAAIANHLIAHHGVTRLALGGYSMGGNLVLKLAGEWSGCGPKRFRAVVAVCPAMDLAASADALHLAGNRFYEGYFLRNLRRRMREKERLFPSDFDSARLQGIKSLREFDDKITAFYCGFKGADDYYARCAATNVIDRIAVPTLILQAANDPFIRVLPDTRRKIQANPWIQFVETPDGGHCSFIGRAANGDSGDDGFWAENRLIEFLRQS